MQSYWRQEGAMIPFGQPRYALPPWAGRQTCKTEVLKGMQGKLCIDKKPFTG
jgi:hypothetical protein